MVDPANGGGTLADPVHTGSSPNQPDMQRDRARDALVVRNRITVYTDAEALGRRRCTTVRVQCRGTGNAGVTGSPAWQRYRLERSMRRIESDLSRSWGNLVFLSSSLLFRAGSPSNQIAALPHQRPRKCLRIGQ